jgi:hypothetical protein
MIPVITKTDKIEGALDYNENKVNAKKATFISSNMIDYDTSIGLTKEDIKVAFSERLRVNRRTKNPIVRISLNVHPDDVSGMDDYKWERIAEDYLKEMGYEDQPYVIYRHNDTKREHIHIITTDIDKYGKKVVNDKFYKIKSEVVRRMLEERHHLISADISKNINEKEKIGHQKIDINKNIAHQIKDIIEFGKTYRYGTIGEFTAFLETFNVGSSVEYSDKKEVSGLLFFPTDDNGKRLGSSIKSSSLGNRFNHTAILNNATKDNIIKKGRNAKTKERIESSVQKLFTDIKSGKNDKEAFNVFKQEIQKQDINVVFRTNDKNRIYGVTFIDNRGKNIVNGSKLGKLFTANSFNEVLKRDVFVIEKDNAENLWHKSINTQSQPQKQRHAINEDTYIQQEQKQAKDTSELLSMWDDIYSGDYKSELFSTTGHIQRESSSRDSQLPEWKKRKKKSKTKKTYKTNI